MEFFGAARWIEAFCERTSPAVFLAEPLNVASNIAILLAAMVLARRAVTLRPTAQIPSSVQALIALIAAVAVASTLYHAAPMQWSYALDVQASHVFVLWFAVCFARWMLGIPWSFALLAIPVFGGCAWLIERALPDYGLDIARFMPVALGLPLLALILWFLGRRSWHAFAGASAAFALALAFHKTDTAMCSALPMGTHFLWHAFNGVTLFLVTREVLERSIVGAKPAGARPAVSAVRIEVAAPITSANRESTQSGND